MMVIALAWKASGPAHTRFWIDTNAIHQFLPLSSNGKISLWYGEVDGSNPSEGTNNGMSMN